MNGKGMHADARKINHAVGTGKKLHRIRTWL
jgi:hypothetical protein